jgi:predicted CoA-binding protein
VHPSDPSRSAPPPAGPQPTATTAGRLIDSDEAIAAFLRTAHRVAVLGIKPDWTAKPAHFVPAYAQRAGLEIIPVPVYYPEVTEILGRPVYRRLIDVPGPIDIIDVFRRPDDIPPHVPDMIAAHPRLVWMQSGIRHDAAAAQLIAAGIDVVMDRCLMVELRRIRGG